MRNDIQFPVRSYSSAVILICVLACAEYQRTQLNANRVFNYPYNHTI
jgi:hypothetical protein